jgi:hypothetical protein
VNREAQARQRGRADWIAPFLVDVAVGVIWALLLAAAILFSSGVSQFIYVDF